MKQIRLISLAATIVVALLLVLWMNIGRLSFDPASLRQPPRPTTALLVEEEEFVDLYTPEPVVPAASEASPAFNETVENNKATPAPETGMDLTDNGPEGVAEQPVTTRRESPLKKEVREKKKEEKKGPAKKVDKEKQKQEEARRKAAADMKSAFQNSSGKNNTENKGKTEGNAGKPTGSTATKQNGHGTGSVNGGWKMPAYAKVPSNVTGTIKLKADVDRSGKVTSVEVIGGDAPAATNSALIEACKAEVRSKKFTRSDSNPPEKATAYITYRFR